MFIGNDLRYSADNRFDNKINPAICKPIGSTETKSINKNAYGFHILNKEIAVIILALQKNCKRNKEKRA